MSKEHIVGRIPSEAECAKARAEAMRAWRAVPVPTDLHNALVDFYRADREWRLAFRGGRDPSHAELGPLQDACDAAFQKVRELMPLEGDDAFGPLPS